MSFCSLTKGITPKICWFCLVLINSVLLNLLCVWSTESIMIISDGEKGGKGGMEVGEEGDYIPIATLSPPEGLLH